MNLKDTVAARQQRLPDLPEDESGQDSLEWVAWPGRLAVITAVVLAPWMIGSVHSRALWLLAVLAAVATASWWLDVGLKASRARSMPWLALLVLGGIVLGLLQIVPLNGDLATLLTGRQQEIYGSWSSAAVLGNPPPARISIDPEATWRQILLLVLAFGYLGSAASLFRRPQDLICLMSACTVNGVVLSLFGILQRLTWNGRLFWQIELSQGGAPFASFVNRNNAAGYLLLCLAAAIWLINHLWTRQSSNSPHLIISREIPIWRQFSTWLQIVFSELTFSKLASLIGALVIAVGVLATLSRGGVIALLGGAMVATLYYGMARRPQGSGLLIFPLMLAVALLTGWIGFYEPLMDRFGSSDWLTVQAPGEESGRLRTWSETIGSFPQLGWLGAGLGGYPSVHRMYSTLRETVVFEYAENQFVQAFVDGGPLALALLTAAVLLGAYYALFILYRGSSSATVATGAMGVFLVVSQTIASLFDFGWYIPAITVSLSALAGILGYQAHSLAGRLRKKTPLRLMLPAWLSRGTAIVTFSAVVMAAVVFGRFSATDSRLIRNIDTLVPEQLDEAATEAHYRELTELAGYSRRPSDYQYLGRVTLRLARLGMLDQISKATALASLSPTQRASTGRNLWDATSPGRMVELVRTLAWQAGPSFSAEILGQEFIRKQLPLAAGLFEAASRQRPLDPETQLTLAQIELLLGNDAEGRAMAENAVRMCPTSFMLRFRAASALLASGMVAEATPHLRRMLELDPVQFGQTIRLLKNQTARLARPLDDSIIASEVLPDNPRQLFDFAMMVTQDPVLRESLLSRAAALLEDVKLSDHAGMVLKADVWLAMGDRQQGIDLLRSSLTSDPNDSQSRFRLARLLFEADQTSEALEQVRQLLASNQRYQPYVDLYQAVEKRIREKADGSRPFPVP